MWPNIKNLGLVAILSAQRKGFSLVGSFPEFRPVLGEAAEDLCVGGGHSDSGLRSPASVDPVIDGLELDSE